MNSDRRWPLERVLFALAGTVTLLSAALAAVVSPWFLLLTAFVGINQWLYVVVGACPASVVLRRACRLRSAIYENGRQLPREAEGGGDLMSVVEEAARREPVPGAVPARGERRADRSARPLHGHAFPGRARRVAARRARAGVLRPEGGDRAVGRGLGDDRLAVGAGPAADRQELPRAVELRADDGDLLAHPDDQRPGLQEHGREGREHAARRQRGAQRRRADAQASRSRATGTPRSCRPARPRARTGWSRRPTR